MAIKREDDRKIVVFLGERTLVFPKTHKGLTAYARFIAQSGQIPVRVS